MSIPKGDGQYSEWMDRYNGYLNSNFERLGLTAEQLTALDLQHLQWDTDYAAYAAAHVTAKASTRTKINTRKALDDLVRGLNRIIQACPATTDADREQLGLTVAGTGTSGMELGADDRPVADIDINQRQTHRFKVYTMTPEGVKRAKPVGALGVEVRRKIGDAPMGVEDMEVVDVMSKTTFDIAYPDSCAGKMVHYAMRWVMRNGQKGAWGETESVTIAA